MFERFGVLTSVTDARFLQKLFSDVTSLPPSSVPPASVNGAALIQLTTGLIKHVKWKRLLMAFRTDTKPFWSPAA